jgi:undecaprenyl-diphosphatase
MTAVQAFILGVIQGACEFLPISSSGHLVLFQKLFGVNEGAMSFDIIVHFGTLISLCAVMRKKLLAYLRNPLGYIPKMVVLGTIPTVIIVLVFGRVFKDLFETGISLGIGFIYTAIILYIAENHGGGYGDGYSDRDESRVPAAIENRVTPQGALFVGIAQGIAVIPAVSRSGSTIAGGVICNFGKRAAIEFAFLMSIPVTLLAVAKDILDMALDKSGGAAGMASGAAAGTAGAAGPIEMAIGFIAAAITGYFAAHYMLTAIRKIKLTWFSLYAGSLGFLILLDQLFFGVVFDKFF